MPDKDDAIVEPAVATAETPFEGLLTASEVGEYQSQLAAYPRTIITNEKLCGPKCVTESTPMSVLTDRKPTET